MCIYVWKFISSPVGDGKEHNFYPLIGVFWLCAGDDRLDELPVGSVNAEFRGVLCGGTWLHPLANHGRAVLARAAPQRHGDRGPSQLDGKLRSRHRFP